MARKNPGKTPDKNSPHDAFLANPARQPRRSSAPKAATRVHGIHAPAPQESWRVFRILAEFVEGFETMAPVGPAVTIFGSARTRPTDPFYKQAQKLASLLVKEKFAVITGGGPGIMEAANRGAYEAGGESIGLNITLPQEQQANRYQTISMDFHYFYARKVMFVKYAHAFVCFPGGYGTLDEFFETITLIQTLKIDPLPILLYGREHWSGLTQWLATLKPDFIDIEDTDIFRIVDTPAEALREIKAAVKKSWWHPLDAELAEQSRAMNHRHSPPIRGAQAGSTGEGTRYGVRPRRTRQEHADAPKKPTQ